MVRNYALCHVNALLYLAVSPPLRASPPMVRALLAELFQQYQLVISGFLCFGFALSGWGRCGSSCRLY
jgi:hypothetical protein